MVLKLGLTTGLAILLLSGCSGGDSSDNVENVEAVKQKTIKEQLSERHFVGIYKHFSESECLNKVKPALEDLGLVNVIVSVEDNNIACEDYDRKNDDIECIIEDTGLDLDTSCVAGGDAPGTPERDSIDINLLDEANIAVIKLI